MSAISLLETDDEQDDSDDDQTDESSDEEVEEEPLNDEKLIASPLDGE